MSPVQESCLPNCLDDPQPYVEVGWSDSERIDFFIPASDGVIDAILYGFPSNGTGEIATFDLLNTASLNIHPTGDTVVTLATGQSFTPVLDLSADFDVDGDVDGADLTHPTLGWQTQFGDGSDGGRFLARQRQFGDVATNPSAAIPEPATRGLLVIGLAVVFLQRRRRRECLLVNRSY